MATGGPAVSQMLKRILMALSQGGLHIIPSRSNRAKQEYSLLGLWPRSGGRPYFWLSDQASFLQILHDPFKHLYFS